MGQKILVVIDMQNDFVDGALGTAEAKSIVSAVREKITAEKAAGSKIIFTRDTHLADYLQTAEGRKLPVTHCIKDSQGWEIVPELSRASGSSCETINKVTFGSKELGERLYEENQSAPISEIELIGVCTDICVISNALLLKAFLPEVRICVNSSCCAGTTPSNHDLALAAMGLCQIDII